MDKQEKEKRDKRRIKNMQKTLGYITLPIHGLSLKGWKEGALHFKFSDCIAKWSGTVNGKEFKGSIGGAVGGSIDLQLGENTFTVRPDELWDAFAKFQNEHPELRDFDEALPRHDEDDT